MLKAATSRLLKARSGAYNPGRLLTNNLMLMHPNNKIFDASILKGKSTLSQPVPHIPVTPYLDYFEKEEAFQIKQGATFLKSKPYDVLALKFAGQHIKSIPHTDSVAKIGQRKMDIEKVVDIIIEVEVSNTKLEEACVKTKPQNSTDVHQVGQIGQCNMDSNKTEDNKEKNDLKTMPQNSTDTKDLGSKVGQDNKNGNKTERTIELYNANLHSIRIVLFDKMCQDNMNSNKTTDSERKAALFKASLRNAYGKNIAINSYITEPNVKIKQNNMNSKKTVHIKSLASKFNAGLLKEMPQNSYNTKDSTSKIGPYNIGAKKTADRETRSGLFNAVNQEAARTSMALNYIKSDLIDHTKQRNRDGKKTENNNLTDVLNVNALKDTYVQTSPDSYETEPIADSGHRNMDCNKTVDNKIKTNFNIGKAYSKNMPQNSTSSVNLNSVNQVNKDGNVIADSERKAKVFNASLLKETYANIMPQISANNKVVICNKGKDNKNETADNKIEVPLLNSYSTEPNMKIKQHNMDSKKTVNSQNLAQLFNTGILKETCAKIMPQNPSNRKDSIHKIGQDDMGANETADSETKAFTLRPAVSGV